MELILADNNLGVLVECDPSIKSIIVKIDSVDHAFIVEELDDEHLVIKENMLTILKMKLDEVASVFRLQVARLTRHSGFEGNASCGGRI